MEQKSANERLVCFAAALPYARQIPPAAAMAGLSTYQGNDLDTLGGDHSAAFVINEAAVVAGSARSWQERWLLAPISEES